MRSPLQEKIQITIVPTAKENGESWVSFESARNTNGMQGFTARTSNDVDGRKFNMMPPGMDIDNQDRAEINALPHCMSGESDQSADTNASSFRDGFKRRVMRGVDDQYTDEHVDYFYGSVVGEDGEGFAERNNYLDRI